MGLLGFLSLRPAARTRSSGCPPGLLVGGALGNLADRVRDEAVTDFIDLPAWPTFNLADVAIVVGVLMLVLLPEFRARAESRDHGPLSGRPSPGSSTRTRPCWWSTSPPASSSTRRPRSRGRPWWTGSARAPGGGEHERPGIVQRLDKDTSGLMVVARDEAARSALARPDQGAGGESRVPGAGRGRRWTRAPARSTPRSGRDRRRRTRRAVRGAGEREARTHFEVIERCPRTRYVRARLETGRTHQIRVHFAAIGHPVAGTPSTAPRGVTASSASSCTRRAWASRIPVTGEALSFTSELPADLGGAGAPAWLSRAARL